MKYLMILAVGCPLFAAVPAVAQNAEDEAPIGNATDQYIDCRAGRQVRVNDRVDPMMREADSLTREGKVNRDSWRVFG